MITLFGSSVAWIASGAKHTGISSAFRQATLAVSIYILFYAALVELALRERLLHPLNYNYYSVQFWLFYNLILSGALLWQMYKTMEQVQAQHILNENSSSTSARPSLRRWQLKTAGVYIALAAGIFCFLVYS